MLFATSAFDLSMAPIDIGIVFVAVKFGVNPISLGRLRSPPDGKQCRMFVS